jgi:hypothetical protein
VIASLALIGAFFREFPSILGNFDVRDIVTIPITICGMTARFAQVLAGSGKST